MSGHGGTTLRNARGRYGQRASRPAERNEPVIATFEFPVVRAFRAGPAIWVVRGTLLALAAVLAVVHDVPASTYWWLGAVALGNAACAALGVRESPLLRYALAVEVLVVAAGVVAGGAHSPLLVCLPAPAFAAGVRYGHRGGLLAAGGEAAVLLGGLPHVADVRTYTSSTAQWVVLALLTGFVGASLRSLARGAARDLGGYAEALRLLDELRAVTRGLPGSLDPGTVAGAVLEDCATHLPHRYGAVLLTFGHNDRLVPIALRGTRRVPWRPSLTDDGPFRAAWESAAVVEDVRPRDEAVGRRRGSVLRVFPVCHGERRIGLVALESDSADTPPNALQRVQGVVDGAALPLETAALFDELRMSAAAEERSRLAREMHDGIAQDLAYLGFEVDAVAHHLRKDDPRSAAERVHQLREAITTLTGDLRLSITDLRSSIGPARALGAALTEYARSVATNSGVTVRLSLTEAATRLSADREVQLLRIAHEALNLARKHQDMRTLSVTLFTDPPLATLEIVDDGVAPSDAKDAAASLRAMGERAERIGARLEASVSEKGTRIRVTLGGAQ
jgi:signal transduction histidine kinase